MHTDPVRFFAGPAMAVASLCNNLITSLGPREVPGSTKKPASSCIFC